MISAATFPLFLGQNDGKVAVLIRFVQDGMVGRFFFADVTWKSAKTSVATVDANGKVTAGAKAGGRSTTISVTSLVG